ncbi:MAG: histidine kinase, partial [Chitinophagaceae bacterium]|nr:histidine kinase [Chitinophagaceae bacterium]
ISVGKSAQTLSDGTIWSFAKDSSRHMWIGTRENGLNKIDLQTNLVTQYDASRYPEFSNNGIRCLYQFRPHEMMVGTEKGLFSFDTENDKLVKVFPLNERENSYKSIKCIYIDCKKRYWIATDGGGIAVLDQQYKLLKNFNAGNGLNNNVVYGILPQNDSSFWISTNAGICNIIWNENNIYKNAILKSHSYDELNGLQSNEFNTGAYTMLRDGNMVFGGLNGINIFKPEEIRNNPVKPEVYINEFKIFDNALVSDVNISYLDHVNLRHFENSISISFSTLGFSLPEKTDYQYRLVGYDKGWIHSKGRNYVSYTNLPSGNYEFQVKATNYDGIWNEKPGTIKITIATPFYNTWWFYLLIAAAIGVVIFAFYTYRTRQIKHRERIKLQFTKELAEVEMKALRAQINPHFLFNSLNSINNYILKNDTRLASRYLIKFSQLVRNILNNSSSPYITLEEELKTIELYMLIEGMRFSNQFSYKIDVEEGLNPAVHYIPSLLLQPYVENAIWHGLLHKDGEKIITISVRKIESNSISITIEDNGVGRKAAKEIEQKPKHMKSFGMELGESRIRLLNQENGQTAKVDVIDLYNEEKDPSGTKIDIVIPAKINVTETSILN